jgi:hypothetical protein
MELLQLIKYWTIYEYIQRQNHKDVLATSKGDDTKFNKIEKQLTV